ncbi:MAG TPA: GNAT family N-acetyltransferase [Sphingopyxis sp.]|nr:GNAT family N-acetyltransferase [Sphingopyxis sp.]HMP45939.1 GNAT family N-acetyltransferase [Sphingopyxis sp.]HMQ18315.1 GNAT family N-acetyltransferase [Sphingopyxis sp.]
MTDAPIREAGDDGEMSVVLRIELAGRSLGAMRRRLRLMRYGLDAVLAGRARDLPPPGRDGWFIRSVPLTALDALRAELDGWLVVVRQTYHRHYLPMAGLGFDGWWQGFSGKTRSTLKRKAGRIEREIEGLEMRAYRTPEEVRAFMTIAGELSERTYQAKLLQAGLPTGDAAVARAVRMAEADDMRGFILFAGDRAIAYLYLPVEEGVVIYGFLGYDPDFAQYSPGSVLHVEAMRALFAEGRFRHFDFTEGDGAHKAQFGRGSVECADIVALRPTLRNRAALALIGGADAVARWGKGLLDRIGLRARVASLLRRG